MELIAQLLLVVHILAVVAGGSTGVINMMTGPKLAAASPDTRAVLYSIQDLAEKVGKISMAVLLTTGLLILWTKWNFSPPNGWFWVKMAGLVGMLVFIALGGRQTSLARSGGPAAPKAIAAKVLFGKLTSVSFLVVLLGVVLAFR